MLEKQTYFSRVPHSGGTSVSSAGLFFEQFGKMTLEHRVFIVIGLILVFMCSSDTRTSTAVRGLG